MKNTPLNKKLFLSINKVILRLVYYLGCLPFVKNGITVVLCYHSFTKGVNKYAISKDSFFKQLLKLKKSATFVSIEKFIEEIKAGITARSIISVTIDDGYKDVLSIVPFTRKHKIPVAIFVLSNPEKANRRELDCSEQLLSINDLKYLKDQGWTIGCHSATHADLTKLTGKELEKEIIASKKTLEKSLGFPVEYFAYPKGNYNKKINNIVKKAGYKAAFTTDAKSADGIDNLLTLPRVVMEDRDLSDFPAFISRLPLFIRSFIEKDLYSYVK